MHKINDNISLYSSARSGRVTRIVLAPPLLILAVFGVGILLQIPIGYLIYNFSFSLGMILNQLGTLLIPALLIIKFFGLTGSYVIPFRKVRFVDVMIAIMMMSALAVITDYLLYVTEFFLPVPTKLNQIYSKLMEVKGFGAFVYKFGFLCILPSFCEEIYFRGFCLTGLSKHYGNVLGVIITALMFAAAHLSPWYFHIYFILGLILGWLFISSSSLWIPIICHMVNNSWTFTAHTIGLHLPTKEIGIDVVILSIAIIILSISVYLWIITHRK